MAARKSPAEGTGRVSREETMPHIKEGPSTDQSASVYGIIKAFKCDSQFLWVLEQWNFLPDVVL